jgi:hypothetical protein
MYMRPFFLISPSLANVVGKGPAVGERSRQGAGATQHFIERRAKLKQQVYSNSDRSWETLIKPLRQEQQSIDSASGRADGHDVAIGHVLSVKAAK